MMSCNLGVIHCVTITDDGGRQPRDELDIYSEVSLGWLIKISIAYSTFLNKYYSLCQSTYFNVPQFTKPSLTFLQNHGFASPYCSHLHWVGLGSVLHSQQSQIEDIYSNCKTISIAFKSLGLSFALKEKNRSCLLGNVPATSYCNWTTLAHHRFYII